jgi:hypothetical protein
MLRRLGVRGLSRKFGGPTLQGEALQFGDNFINDRITNSKRATRFRLCQ